MTNPYTELFNGKQPLILRRPFLLPNGYHAEPLFVYRALAIEWLAQMSRSPVQVGCYVGGWTIRYYGESVEFRGPTLDHALNAACHAALDAQERGRE